VAKSQENQRRKKTTISVMLNFLVPLSIPYHSATTMTHSSAAFFLPGSFRKGSELLHRKYPNVRLPKTSVSLLLATTPNTDPTSSLDAGTLRSTDTSRNLCIRPILLLTITSSALTSTYDPVVFEPVLNVPALGTFLFVMVIFGLLSIRTNQVEQAVQERNLALKELREAKSKELSGGKEVNVQQALEQFDKAMEKEESLRTIIPGVRIVPPSNGNNAEEEARVAARQFLDKDVAIGASKQEEGDGRLPMAALGVLTLLAASLVVLLVFLSLDPVTSNNVLDSVGGNNNFL
jgi:hypothetical protein